MNKLLLLFGILLTTACGDSHRVSDSRPDATTEEATAECEMYFKTEKLCLQSKWEVMATPTEPGHLTLTFKDKNDSSRIISPRNEPFIYLWMPSMNHGSSPVTLTLIQDGIYKTEDIFFIMPGPWEIRYQIKDGEQVIEEVVQSIQVVF